MDRHKIGFAIVASLISIIFIMIVNYLTSPNYMWFIYPVFALLFWPGSIIFIAKKKYKLQSIFGSVVIITFLIITNYLHSPDYLWFHYAIFPIIWWPVSAFYGEKAKTLSFALIGSMSTILYYSLLNVIMSHQHPWAIYPAFIVLWWPLALYYARKKDYFGLSVSGSLLTILFFITVNAVSSPSTIWAIYPAFIVLWWPLALYHARKRDYFGLSVSGSLLTILFFITVNAVSSPSTIWAIYPIFIVLWWPLSMYYYQFKRR
ncbi:hypothetical protein [Bacillus sp. FSL K6-3431]|uniref:hypothetical protein n=1 Tax=Bacillus sp. FSL K6-3431 TaxID=2921500 RepID=UPI0030F9442F